MTPATGEGTSTKRLGCLHRQQYLIYLHRITGAHLPLDDLGLSRPVLRPDPAI